MSDDVEDLGQMPHASKVEAMAGYGLTASEIARVLKLDIEVLKASYADELEGGQIKANARIAESLYRLALGPGREAVTAAIFWLKARARWKEVSVHEHGGAENPVQISVIKRIIVSPRSREDSANNPSLAIDEVPGSPSDETR